MKSLWQSEQEQLISYLSPHGGQRINIVMLAQIQ